MVGSTSHCNSCSSNLADLSLKNPSGSWLVRSHLDLGPYNLVWEHAKGIDWNILSSGCLAPRVPPMVLVGLALESWTWLGIHRGCHPGDKKLRLSRSKETALPHCHAAVSRSEFLHSSSSQSRPPSGLGDELHCSRSLTSDSAALGIIDLAYPSPSNPQLVSSWATRPQYRCRPSGQPIRGRDRTGSLLPHIGRIACPPRCHSHNTASSGR